MRKILSLWLLNIFGIVLCRYVWGSPEFVSTPTTMALIGLFLTVFEILLKPIINLLLLPINVLTLGLIKIATNTLGLYLVGFLLEDFRVLDINRPSFTWEGFTIPTLSFHGFASYVIISLTLSIFISFTSFFLHQKD